MSCSGRQRAGKQFEPKIADGVFEWLRRAESIGREADIDGLYLIRGSEGNAAVPAADTVRRHKRLGQVERAVRCLNGVYPRARPILDRTPERVRSAAAQFARATGGAGDTPSELVSSRRERDGSNV